MLSSRLLPTVHRLSSFVFRLSSFRLRPSSFVIRHSSFVILLFLLAACAPTPVPPAKPDPTPKPPPEPAALEIEARFLLVPRAFLDAFDPPLLPPTAASADTTHLQSPSPAILTPAQLHALLLALARSEDARILATPRLTTRSGQAARLDTTAPQKYISAYKLEDPPATATAPATPPGRRPLDPTYIPTIITVHPGLTLALTPTLAPDQKTITLDLDVTHLQLRSLKKIPAPHTAPEDEMTVQIPDLIARRLHLSAAVPPDQTLLALIPEVPPATSEISNIKSEIPSTTAPATLPAPPIENQKSRIENPLLLLLLRPTIVESPTDTPATQPATAPRVTLFTGERTYPFVPTTQKGF